jgi:recombination protein RecA
MKIGVMFGNPETTSGGNALKFYASVRLDIRRIASIKDHDDVVGNRVKVKVAKNKVAAPFKTVEFDIYYDEGISRSGEILDLAVEKNIVEKSGTWFSYKTERLGQGREAARGFLKQHPETMEELEHKIRAAMGLPALGAVVAVPDAAIVAAGEDEADLADANGRERARIKAKV